MIKTSSKFIFASGIALTVFLVWILLPYSIKRNSNQDISAAVELDSNYSPLKVTARVQVWSHDLLYWKPNRTVCSEVSMDHEAVLNSSLGIIPISVYNPADDIFISKRIIKTQDFDGQKRQQISAILSKDDSLNFIDFGCNIGVYTLTAAKMGRQVICIEALYRNVQHVCASADANNMQKNIKVVLNAVSAGHDTVNLAVDFKNMGGTFVDDRADFVKRIKGKSVQGGYYNKVTTITMDDLLKLPFINKFKKVVIKMDIEGFEARALQKAHNFFHNIYVQGVLMEWIFHRKKESGFQIIRFMRRRKFLPYSVNLRRLPHSRNGNWAVQDVLWLRT